MYLKELLKRFNMDSCKDISTPMGFGTYLDHDESRIPIDITKYWGIICYLSYLTASRLDIIFSVCLCAWFQAWPKESHLTVVNRIMEYLKGTSNVSLWYPKDSVCSIVGFSYADYAGCETDRKSTSGTCYIFGNALVCWSCKKKLSVALTTTEAEYIVSDSCYAQILWLNNNFMTMM